MSLTLFSQDFLKNRVYFSFFVNKVLLNQKKSKFPPYFVTPEILRSQGFQWINFNPSESQQKTCFRKRSFEPKEAVFNLEELFANRTIWKHHPNIKAHFSISLQQATQFEVAVSHLPWQWAMKTEILNQRQMKSSKWEKIFSPSIFNTRVALNHIDHLRGW